MTKILDVPDGVLAKAKAAWDDAGDQLDGSWRRLARASTTDLAAEVAAAVATFQDAWTDQLKSLAGLAADHSEAFVRAAGEFRTVDVAEAERLRSLLPWSHRGAPIRGS